MKHKNKLDEDQQKLEEELAGLLKYFGCQDYSQYQERLLEYQAKIESKRDLTSKLEALLYGEDWKIFVEKHADLDNRVTAQKKELEQLQSYALEPVILKKSQEEIEELEKQKIELDGEKSGLEKYFSYTEVEKDQLVEIEEELYSLEQQKVHWERQREIYNMTYRILEDAQKQTLLRASDVLEKEIGHYVSVISDGKYSQVKIDETDMSITTLSPEKGEWVDVEQLSRATRDQFYICARFALARLITEGKHPPFLLDDPFVNFHAKRLRQSVPLLKEIARENQILLFTCCDAYDYLGNVIMIED